MHTIKTLDRVGGNNCYGLYVVNNTASFAMYEKDITTRNAMMASKKLHHIFQDANPYKFVIETVNDVPDNHGFNGSMMSSAMVCKFAWGMRSTTTTGPNKTYQELGARFYFRMRNKGKNNMNFILACFASQMACSRYQVLESLR